MEQFISNFAAQFDDTELSEFAADTKFKDLEEWSSLTALSIIAMVDDEYNVRVSGEDIRNASSIAELYNVVISRK